jgi:hypothetical protein
MTTDRWRRIEALYHETLARPEHERGAALAAACLGDAALQAEVQSLLDQSAPGFPYPRAGGRRHRLARGRAADRAAHRRSRWGLLGVGGMGEVYARGTAAGAEVAIKILPRVQGRS